MALQLPIVKVTLCSHLKGVKPGELPNELLRPIEGKGKLHHCAADAYEAMDAAANAEGIDLSPTSQADTYRSLETQEYGFYQRHTDNPNKKLLKQKPRIYKGKAWYLKKGMAPMAAPIDDIANGSARGSRHLYGIAIDVANASGPILEWLLKNEEQFGFSHEVLGDSNGKGAEPWHLRLTDPSKVQDA